MGRLLVRDWAHGQYSVASAKNGRGRGSGRGKRDESEPMGSVIFWFHGASKSEESARRIAPPRKEKLEQKEWHRFVQKSVLLVQQQEEAGRSRKKREEEKHPACWRATDSRAAMAPAGSLHVTVIAATLLRDAGGSDSEPADTYASVGCGNQNFTTNTVKNHRTKPAWNESHTFKIEEKSELESQHILIEIFAEKPKLDELLGLAKIPLHKVISVGDEISTHSLNRPDEEYIGHEQYSGHVKVALRWDSQVTASYPQTYTPAARYNPNVSTVRGPVLSRQTSRSTEQLQTSNSGEELHHAEDSSGAGQERKVHHRSSSYPSRSYSFKSSAPAPSPSPSKSPWKQPPESDGSYSPLPHPSSVLPPGAYPARHSSVGSYFPSHYEQGRGPSPHVPYAGPHVPYVPHEGNKAANGISAHGHLAYQRPIESGVAHLDAKPQEDAAKSKLSKSKQAEMAKLAELSRLTESAKIQATGFAKAGGQAPSPRPKQSALPSQPLGPVSPSPTNDASLQQQNQNPPRRKSDVGQVHKENQALEGSQKDGMQPQPLQQLTNGPQRPRNGEVQPEQQTNGLPKPNNTEVQPQQQLANGPHGQQDNVQSQQLAVINTRRDIVPAQTQKPQGDKAQQLQTTPRPADVFYEKAILKVDKPEKKKKIGHFRQTLKMLRKTTKIFSR